MTFADGRSEDKLLIDSFQDVSVADSCADHREIRYVVPSRIQIKPSDTNLVRPDLS